MLRIKDLGISILLLGALSCSIVKDSDVTSLDQFNKLTLKSFDIVENDGNVSTYTATLKYDSVQNFNTPSKFGSYHITRLVGFSLPSLGGRKMQILGNNVNAQNANMIRIYYRSDGKPYFLEIRASAADSTVAFYRFLYYSTGQLASLVTHINPIDNKPFTVHTKDTLFYSSPSLLSSSNNLSGITRKSNGTSISLEYSNCTSCNSSLIRFTPSGTNSYQLQSGSCNNESNNTYSCGSLQFQKSGINGTYNVGIQIIQSLGKTSQITFSDTPAGTDVYFFHPLMLLQDIIPEADELLWIFAYDWWDYRLTSTGSQSGSNRLAQINFHYGK